MINGLRSASIWSESRPIPAVAVAVQVREEAGLSVLAVTH